jgi:hypothetical protein
VREDLIVALGTTSALDQCPSTARMTAHELNTIQRLISRDVVAAVAV